MSYAARAAVIVLLSAGAAAPALAQDWFVPPSQQQGGPKAAGPRAPAAARGPSEEPAPGVPIGGPEGPGGPEAFGGPEQPPQIQVPLPPVPPLPEIPKGSTPPALVLGVLSVPDVMRQSTAAQEMQKVLGERSKKLHDDAQKEQASWRDTEQQLAGQRGTLSAEQIHQKETALQERVSEAQKKFRDRDQIIKEAAQYGLLQIEKVLESVIQQVAASRNMNMVLHREQVMLNYPEFDLTQQVAEELNKILPSVRIPPDGVSAVAFADQVAKEQAGGKPGQPGPTVAAAAAAAQASARPAPAKK